MEKKENSKLFKPKSIKREVGDRTGRILVTKMEVEHLIVTGKILDPRNRT